VEKMIVLNNSKFKKKILKKQIWTPTNKTNFQLGGRMMDSVMSVDFFLFFI
jgi:hypothetical protein